MSYNRKKQSHIVTHLSKHGHHTTTQQLMQQHDTPPHLKRGANRSHPIALPFPMLCHIKSHNPLQAIVATSTAPPRGCHPHVAHTHTHTIINPLSPALL
jgi:hypothetical protein